MYNIFSFLSASGIACPLSSLTYEKDFGIGDLKGAYKFVDFLAESGFCAWKMLPIHELVEENNFSPYDPISAFAIDSLYLDIMSLEDINYNELNEYIYLNRLKFHQQADTHFSEIRKFKNEILRKAFEEFYTNEFLFNSERFKAFQDFINENHEWILDYGLYRAISDELRNIPLKKWPDEIKTKDKVKITEYRKKLEKDIFYYQYIQWICLLQWQKFKAYANKKGVFIIGDVSFYVGAMSVDVWANPQNFKVDKTLHPLVYGGCPPDEISPNGQIWQVAVYDWKALKNIKYDWWIHRLDYLANLFDCLRIDHFRGFQQYWQIENPETPSIGEWVEGPGIEFVNLLTKHLQDKRLCSLYVENLGFITEDVNQVREKMGLRGTLLYGLEYKRIHQHDFSQINIIESTNHDILPLKKWWLQRSEDEKRFILSSLGMEIVQNDLYEMSNNLRLRILEYLVDQRLPLTLFSIQDVLGLDTEINKPGTIHDNWTFRLPKNVEGLLQNKVLISQLGSISKKTKTNRFTSIERVLTFPQINGTVERYYVADEPIIFWAFTAKRSDEMLVVTNLSKDFAIREVPMKLVSVSSVGSLFFFSCTVSERGSYFLTLKVNGEYQSEFERDLKIIVKD